MKKKNKEDLQELMKTDTFELRLYSQLSDHEAAFMHALDEYVYANFPSEDWTFMHRLIMHARDIGSQAAHAKHAEHHGEIIRNILQKCEGNMERVNDQVKLGAKRISLNALFCMAVKFDVKISKYISKEA